MDSNVHALNSSFGLKNDIVKLVDSVWKELIFGGHLFASGAVSVIIACATLFMVPLSWDILMISYLLFYAIYLYDYSTGASTDEMTNSTRAKYLRCRNKSTLTVVLVSSILMVLMIVYTNTITTMVGVVILVLGLLYGSHFKKLTKKIPAFKNVFVAFVWAFMAIFVFVYYSIPLTYGAITLAVFIFIRMMNIQILFDVRDMEGDRREGLLTIPAILGEKKYPFILRLINLISILFITLCVVRGILPVFALAVIPVFYYGTGYINRVIKFRTNYTSYIFAAFEPVMWCMLIVAGKYMLISGLL